MKYPTWRKNFPSYFHSHFCGLHPKAGSMSVSEVSDARATFPSPITSRQMCIPSHLPPHLCRAVNTVRSQFHLSKDLPSICCSAVTRALPVARNESVRILFFRLLLPLPAALHRIQMSRSRLILVMLGSRNSRLSDRFLQMAAN